METELTQLTINEEEEEILQIQIDPETGRGVEEFQLVGCFLTTSLIHFPAIRSTMANLWHPVRGFKFKIWGRKCIFFIFYVMDIERVLKGSPWTFNNHLLVLHNLKRGKIHKQFPWFSLFLGVFLEYDGSVLGKENRNFMRVKVQIDVRRPLKRKKQYMATRRRGRGLEGQLSFGGRYWDGDNKERNGKRFDLILGLNLEGVSSSSQRENNCWMDQVHADMEHDLEDGILVGEEGEKTTARGDEKSERKRREW
ncbi:hypothetical protein CXB51_003900 [Gossypium anomalum]|uniref:DUF4283 domain-containing protein n=1 Tax=Gossypium anomalum TaxID=47600 RepID=A0A8J5Z346_9ROSI|nr:hypothetical protein CXB51_003900 [Gossypium anomalum]